jgi:hypothetical protein
MTAKITKMASNMADDMLFWLHYGF